MRKRNLAFYKRSGESWRLEELNKASIYAGDESISMIMEEPYFNGICNRKYIFDDGASSNYMYLWSSQEKDPNFANCEKVAYEDIFDEKD